MPGIYIETYGCQMNVSDSELMLGVLGREGYVRMDDPAQADVVLVNTCAVRDHAEQKVLSRMGELKRLKRPGSVLGVVGCMAQRLGPRLLDRVPQVDLVVGPDGYRGLPELIARARAGERTAEVVFKRWEHYEDIAPVRGGAVSAFVTVQRGCDYRCTFCIVPMTRGPERSRRLEDVVREVTDLASGGTTEVTLLGQTVNSYDDGSHDFADLLRAVGEIPGVRRLRFTSPYPTDFTDRTVAAMAETPAVCEHVHLPLQSGSSRVLKRMLRRYDRDRYLAVVAALRRRGRGVSARSLPRHHGRARRGRAAGAGGGGGGGGARRRGVTNVTFEVVQREYAKLRPQLPRFCGCETCRGDVLVFALNRLAPNYVSTPQGEVLVELRLDSDQEKAKLDVALLEGFRKVGLAPRCGAKPVQLM